jgi:hypothetical protein
VDFQPDDRLVAGGSGGHRLGRSISAGGAGEQANRFRTDGGRFREGVGTGVGIAIGDVTMRRHPGAGIVAESAGRAVAEHPKFVPMRTVSKCGSLSMEEVSNEATPICSSIGRHRSGGAPCCQGTKQPGRSLAGSGFSPPIPSPAARPPARSTSVT